MLAKLILCWASLRRISVLGVGASSITNNNGDKTERCVNNNM